MAHFNPLRPVTQRLNATPVEDLPRYAGYLATSILNCSELLQTSEGSKSDAYVQIHRLTTRVSSLLQDRTQEGRFTAVVLVKALTEAAGSQILAASGSAWVRGLLLCMNKQDPAQIKLLSIVTITRIFLLTKGHQSMLREITSPSLPAFITACLNLIKPRVVSSDGVERQVPSVLLQPILQCWTQLIRAFPSTFRPFVPSIRAITLSLLSQHVITGDTKRTAVEVFSSLHFCAPKDTAAAEWAQSLKDIIEAAHQTADLILRAVVEDWSSASGRQNPTRLSKKPGVEPCLTSVDAIGMAAWTGLQSGCSRLFHHLQLLEAMISNPHAQTMRIPVAEVLDLMARLAAVLLPTRTYTLRENKEIARDERDELYSNLPRIHQALLSIYGQMAQTFGHVLTPVAHQMISHIWDILATEGIDVSTRILLYDTTRRLLQKISNPFVPSDIEYTSLLVRTCCQDLGLGDKKSHQRDGQSNDPKAGTLSIDLQQTIKQEINISEGPSDVEKAANALLPVLLTCLPSSVLSATARAELDRTVVLSGHQKGLLASILNPPLPRKGGRAAPSVLPFLARTGSSELDVEVLMRPRMPIIQSASQMDTDDYEDSAQDIAERESEEPMNATLHAVDDHITQQLVDDDNMNTTSDHSSARKRDHTTAEDAPASPQDGPSKKLRFDEASPNDDRSLNSSAAAQLQSEVKEAGDSTKLSIAAPLESFETMMVSGPEEEAADPIGEVSVVTLAAYTRNEQDADDSDGSEIPQIDTTLSSDEEEDDE